jgi:TM2 domain-containing membrane protein YozV
MNVYIVLGIILIVALIGQLLVAYQMKDRLDKIAELLEKK